MRIIRRFPRSSPVSKYSCRHLPSEIANTARGIVLLRQPGHGRFNKMKKPSETDHDSSKEGLIWNQIAIVGFGIILVSTLLVLIFASL